MEQVWSRQVWLFRGCISAHTWVTLFCKAACTCLQPRYVSCAKWTIYIQQEMSNISLAKLQQLLSSFPKHLQSVI